MSTSSGHRRAVARLVLPPLVGMLLVVAAVRLWMIPSAAEAHLEGKRETLRAIVAAAVSLCQRHHDEERAGSLTRMEAQQRAATALRALRYGGDNRDYLWVIDDAVQMVVHPYRADLEGQSLVDYVDPDGVPLFSASRDLVQSAGEGFLRYRWQHHDDPAQLQSKLTFVQGFPAWGWVVGSGVYLDDVAAGAARITTQLILIAVAVGGVVVALLALAIRQGMASERARCLAEDELEAAHAQAEALAHAASEAVWLVNDGLITGRNRQAVELVGDLPGIGEAVGALFADESERRLAEAGAFAPRTVLLATVDGPTPALVAADPVMVLGRNGLVYRARSLAEDEADPATESRRQAAEEQNDAVTLAEAALLEPAADLAQEVPLLPLTSQPDEVLRALAEQGGSAALLTAPDGGVAGLVTAGDLARRGGTTAYQAMSAPVEAVAAGASVASAADHMASRNIGRLVLDGDTPGLVTAAKVLGAIRQGPGLLCAQARTASQSDLPGLRRRLEAWLASLSRLAVDPERVTAAATGVADAIFSRCAELAAADLGPAPAPYALLAVGSQGRQELLPGSDQDNALVYPDGADGAWFEAFATDCVARYHAAGWPRCHGHCHAGNPRWCLSLSDWQDQFRTWIAAAEPQALLEATVFFDARLVRGEASFVGALNDSTLTAIRQRPVFLVQLAQESLQARSPLGIFGGIRPDDERQGTTDLKHAMLHATSFARIQTLAQGSWLHGTGSRLRFLADGQHVPADFIAEALSAWRHLLALRLAQRSQPGGGDQIDPAELSAWDRSMLKRALTTVENMRERLRNDLNRMGA